MINNYQTTKVIKTEVETAETIDDVIALLLAVIRPELAEPHNALKVTIEIEGWPWTGTARVRSSWYRGLIGDETDAEIAARANYVRKETD